MLFVFISNGWSKVEGLLDAIIPQKETGVKLLNIITVNFLGQKLSESDCFESIKKPIRPLAEMLEWTLSNQWNLI